MFLKSIFVPSRHVVYQIQKVTFARKSVRPRVLRVLDNDGRDLNSPQTERIPKTPPSIIDAKMDEDYIFDGPTFHDSVKKSPKNQSFDVPKYTRATNKKNEFIKMMTNLSIKKRRDEMNVIVIEGKRLIDDAIEAGVKLKYIYFTLENNLRDVKHLNKAVSETGTQLVKVLYKDMKTFSSLVTSPGIMAVAEKPLLENLHTLELQRMPLTLICDNIRDPGNLGAIIRTSAAAGIDKILLTIGCVDAWNDKVIKSAAGAHFRLPLETNIAFTDLSKYLPRHFDLYVADSNQNSSTSELKCYQYFDVKFFDDSRCEQKVLIVSNEAFGPSSKCLELVKEFGGCRVQIPLYHGIESLNSAVASSILLYEIRRQFEIQQK